MENTATEEHYVEKLNANKKFNIFLKYFSLPKSPLFLVTTAVILSEVELLTNVWVPSILAVYIMWEYCIASLTKYMIAEKCIIDEICLQIEMEDDEKWADVKLNCPELPRYVIEEERDEFVFNHVLDYKNTTMIEKFKIYYDELICATLIYAIIYTVLEFL
jgi:hypothetical protein